MEPASEAADPILGVDLLNAPLGQAYRQVVHLTKPDVSAKFRRASPLDNLRAGR